MCSSRRWRSSRHAGRRVTATIAGEGPDRGGAQSVGGAVRRRRPGPFCRLPAGARGLRARADDGHSFTRGVPALCDPRSRRRRRADRRRPGSAAFRKSSGRRAITSIAPDDVGALARRHWARRSMRRPSCGELPNRSKARVQAEFSLLGHGGWRPCRLSRGDCAPKTRAVRITNFFPLFTTFAAASARGRARAAWPAAKAHPSCPGPSPTAFSAPLRRFSPPSRRYRKRRAADRSRGSFRLPRRRSPQEHYAAGLFADRAGRAGSRHRSGADRRRRLHRLCLPMWCRATASPGTTSPPSAASRVLAMLAFQVADIYQVQAFRGHEKQYMRLASAWSVVFLIAISVSFFAKAGDQFSRAWLGSFYVLGLFALIAFRRGLFLLVRRWTQRGPARPPHRRGRLRQQR